MKRAIERGYTHIDTADAYGNHAEIGKAIRGFDRSTIFLTTKVLPNRLRYHEVIQDCNRSLRELHTEYLDLYLIHWPNPNISIDETQKAFNELVDEGKCKSIGVSNFETHHLVDALKVERDSLVNNQILMHPYDYDQALLDFCRQQNIIVTAYSPLGRARILHKAILQGMAKKYGRTTAQIGSLWGLQKCVFVISKTRSEARLKENMDIFNWKISSDDVEKTRFTKQIR